MRVGRAIAIASLAAWLTSACSSEPLGQGDETSGSGVYGNFSTQLPADKPLDSLTDEEAQQLCQEMVEYFEAIWDLQLERGCRYNAVIVATAMRPVTDEEAQHSCQVARAECLATPKPPTDTCLNTAGPARTSPWKISPRPQAASLRRASISS